MNNELKKSLEMRQENLIFLLKNKKEQLELEKQHQIYGAIKEIDYILRMMKVTAEEEAEESIRMNEDPRQVVQVAEKTRQFKIPIKITFQK
jgi:transcription elongation GreA/GreB family factor